MLPDDLITIKEAAKLYRVSRAVIDRAKHLGLFPVWKLEGGVHHVRKSHIEAWWQTARLVKPRHIKKKGVEAMEGAENAKKTQRDFIGAQWL